ncbi:MAG: DUF4266 domain-containing protein [Myxococcales bacterium]|nr:DUF4266 domain-containing protein [Myxococcales bacterium]
MRSHRATLLVGLWALLSGCAAVAPWQRGRLARADMAAPTDDRLSAGEGHALAYREGSSGGGPVQGGGCGCN